MEAGFRRRRHRDRIPFTLVGDVDGEFVGTSTVVECDLPARRDLRPWLAAVFVEPAHRKNGYGSALVRAACDHAVALGERRMHLYTLNWMSFCARLGWAETESRTYRRENVTVMSCDLTFRDGLRASPAVLRGQKTFGIFSRGSA